MMMAHNQTSFDESEDNNDDYYLNEDGLLVFKEKFLLNRGYCCGSGCKHCPYNYDAVPEPKRSFLIQKREKNFN